MRNQGESSAGVRQLTGAPATAASAGPVRVARSAARDPFFLVMGIVMFVITAVGFAPTFYLGPLFDAPRLPWRLSIHGLLSTLWVAFFLVQTVLIRRRSLRVHRRLGVMGVALAAAMVGSGVVVLVAVAREFSGPLPFVAGLVWGNLFILAAFSVFVTLAVRARRRPETHKRLMLLATLAMMGQPLVRIGQLDALLISEVRMVNDAIYGLGGFLLLLLVVVAHDVWVRGRPHPAVAIGGPALLLGMVGMGLVVSNSPLGQALILWLR